MMRSQQKKLYPLILEPIFKQRIWGGRRLEMMLGKRLPAGQPIGESWEVSCRGNDNNVIRNGFFAGKTLRDVMETHPEELLGSEKSPQFPLLNKFIDANELLSVQVHPDGKSAAHFPGSEAKTEAWCIIHAEPGATLIKGLKPATTREKFEEAIRSNTVPSLLNTFPVSSGDTVFVPAGAVHAMGAGLVVCEIQQNSDTTFRVYDWGRVGADGKPRQLHIEQALKVINFDDNSPEKVASLDIMQGANRRRFLVACPFFAAELLELQAPAIENTGGKRFDTYMVLEGKATITTKTTDVAFSAGDSGLIPAAVEEYVIKPSGHCKIIKVFVPDIEGDVVARLRAAGISDARIRQIIF